MGERPISRVRLLERALGRREAALARPEDDVQLDACIQRFEFSFELAWKAIQRQARTEGLDCASPRECLRLAFRLGLVKDDPRWMSMVEDRNRTAHTYDEPTARAVYSALPAYTQLLRDLCRRLGERAP